MKREKHLQLVFRGKLGENSEEISSVALLSSACLFILCISSLLNMRISSTHMNPMDVDTQDGLDAVIGGLTIPRHSESCHI